MFLQLPPDTDANLLAIQPNDCHSSVAEHEINSAVRKAGSFEGTLPRCFSLRSSCEQNSSNPQQRPPLRCQFQAENFKMGDPGCLFRFFR